MFDTIVQRGVGFMLVAIIVYLLLRVIVFRPKKGSVNGVIKNCHLITQLVNLLRVFAFHFVL